MIDQEKLNDQDETTTAFTSQQDEDYGLPEAVYSPLEPQEADAEPEEIIPPAPKAVAEPPMQKSATWPIWLAVVVLLGLAGFFMYFFVFDKQEDVPVAQAPVTTPVTPTPEPEPAIVEEEAPVAEEWTPAEPQEGSVTTISSRTGRYYLVVGSFIDSDMAADYANKLAKQGNKVSILAPSGDRKFYRLGVHEADSFAQLSEQLDSYKSTFGQDIWIIKY